MSLFEFLIFHILPSRTCKKSTESWRERGEDQKAIGSHNPNNWVISFVKVCVHTCILSICMPMWSGWDSDKNLQKIRGFYFAMKISESKKGNCSRRPINLT